MVKVQIIKKNLFKYCIILLFYILLNITGCIVELKQTLVLKKSKKVFIIFKLKDNVEQGLLMEKFSNIAKKISKGNKLIFIIGLYNKNIIDKNLEIITKKKLDGNLVDLIYMGEKIWGGIFTVYNFDNKILVWDYEKKHIDIPFIINRDLIEAGTWSFQNLKYYFIFYYIKDKNVKFKDFKNNIEAYAKVLIKDHDIVDIVIFNDKIECRKFSSKKNKNFLLRMSAITPVNKKEFFRPKHTKNGIYVYHLIKRKGIFFMKWINLK